MKLEEIKSLIIFPEGGILTKNPPHMTPFKDGAFRVAIEKQIAIVPVTIPSNWIILPDQEPLLLQWGIMSVIFHEPIITTGMSLKDVDALKETAYSIINAELKK